MNTLKDDILESLLKAPAPCGISELQKSISDRWPDLNRRSLQRVLNEMLSENMIVRTGSGPATSYAGANTEFISDVIPLSPASRDLMRYLDLPLIKRKPTTYDSGLLFDYQPNSTFLLPESLRSQLHDMGRTGPENRPAGTHLRDVLGRLLIDLSWASSRLEGNRYTLFDTKRLIEEGKAAEGMDRIETVMILNHKAAIEMIADAPEYIGIDRMTFMNLHALLSDGLMRDPEASGRLRRRPVDITGSVYTPTAIPQRIDECFGVILDKARNIGDPFEASFFIMIHIPYLQPFEDVNKRVSRLGANIPLIKANVSPLSFVDMPEGLYLKGMQAFYETGKIDLITDVFFSAYERSCQRYAAVSKSMVDPDPFRLEWRQELYDTVHAIVVHGKSKDPEVIQGSIPITVPAEHHERFAAMVLAEVESLHEGNFMRYRIRPDQFEYWNAKFDEGLPEP
jgi:Fic family protein